MAITYTEQKHFTNAAFYQKFGFEIMADGAAMQLCNFADKR